MRINFTKLSCLFLVLITWNTSTSIYSQEITSQQQDAELKRFMTKSKEPIARRILVRLPLQGVKFHWMFKSRNDYLSGKLVLTIQRNDNPENIIIFDKGIISEGWEAGGGNSQYGEVYFKFQSTKKFLTSPEDKLKLELQVPADLDGIGPNKTGILKAGTYESPGEYSVLIDA